MPRGRALAVFDFGGGTFDVRSSAARTTRRLFPRPRRSAASTTSAGSTSTAALAAHLGQRRRSATRALEAPSNPQTTGELRDRRAFWGEVRAAKEMLSRTSTAPVAVPGHGPVACTSPATNSTSLAGPLVSRAVGRDAAACSDAPGVAPANSPGSSSSAAPAACPWSPTGCTPRLGVAPPVPEQPELPVAFGALRFAVTDQADPAVSTPPATPPTGEPGVLNYAPYPVVGIPSPVPSPFPSPAPSPPPTPAGTQPPPMQTPAGTLPPRTEFTPQAPIRLTFRDIPKVPQGFQGHVRRVVGGALATVIVIVVAFAVSQYDWDGATGNLTDGLLDGVESLGDGIENQGATGPQLALVHEQQLSADGATAVAAVDGMALLAEVVEGETVAYAISPAGEQLWTRTLELEPTDLYLTVVEDLLIVDATASATNAGENMRAALALADGALLWQRQWTDRADLAFYGTDAVVDQHPGHGRQRPGPDRPHHRRGQVDQGRGRGRVPGLPLPRRDRVGRRRGHGDHPPELALALRQSRRRPRSMPSPSSRLYRRGFAAPSKVSTATCSRSSRAAARTSSCT